MCDLFLDMCRDHRCLTACQKQHRQNELASQGDIPTRMDVPVMYHCLSKQHRQHEPAGQVDIPTRVEVHVMGDPGHE